MKLTTKRLILRDYKKEDEDSLQKNIDNLKISRYLEKVPYPYTMKDARWFVDHCLEDQEKKPRTNYEFAIELKDSKGVVGCVGLTSLNRFSGNATLGYWLSEVHWRNGYMTEAVERVLQFAFNTLKLRRIDVEAYTGNEASNNLIKKLGFNQEGTRIKYKRIKATGKVIDAHIYGLLRTDWRKRK